MKPSHCPTCQSDDLSQGQLVASTPIFFRVGMFKCVGVSAIACRACGTIVPFLDYPALSKVRAWVRPARPTSPATDLRASDFAWPTDGSESNLP